MNKNIVLCASLGLLAMDSSASFAIDTVLAEEGFADSRQYREAGSDVAILPKIKNDPVRMPSAWPPLFLWE